MNIHTATVVIRLMKDAFTDNCKGVPVKLLTDGGPQFSSWVLKQFCCGWGITHMQSGPHSPQGNGAAEAAVKSVKYLIVRSIKRGNVSVDLFRRAIIEHRITPREHGLSPNGLRLTHAFPCGHALLYVQARVAQIRS